MARRLFIIALLAHALSSHAATRWFTDRAGAPVRWHDWGPAALQRAKTEKRPIFLSIGTAGSWDAFRMQRDAFAAPENVATLNAYFVPVLLDPLEHPEIAEAYEHALRTMNGAGGNPSNLILTPALEPFAGGGFMTVEELHRMLVDAASRWTDAQASVVAEARANIDRARATAERRAPMDVDTTTAEAVVDDVAKTFERDKTLRTSAVPFLLRYSSRTKHAPLRTLSLETLRARAVSRLRDQLGGGFHRCDTCFDKLLHDQALMALAYLDAFEETNDGAFAHVARTTLDYALRDLRFPKAYAFEAAQDAYSLVPRGGRHVNENGVFYLWTKEEITRVIGAGDAAKVFRLYGMSDVAPNLPLLAEARFFGETYTDLAVPLAALLDLRQKRPSPFREPLIVAASNGLMISALSRAALVLDEPAYGDAARQAAAAVLAKLWDAKTQTLVRTDSRAAALAEDYAMLVAGLLDLFETSQDVKWLDLAVTLQQRQDQLFWDASLGRYTTGTTLPESLRGLLTESDETSPSANAVAAVNLLRLAALTGNETWRARPTMIFQSLGGRLRTDGARLTQLAAAYELSLIAPRVIVITGNIGKEETRELLRTTLARREPMRAVVFLPHRGTARERVVKSLPYTGALAPDPEVPVAYVCANGACRRE